MESDKKNTIIAILIIIIILLVIAVAFLLSKNINKTEGSNTNKTEEKEKITEEENSIDGAALAQRAYDMLPNNLGLAPYLYLGKKIDITKLDSSVKFAWTLHTIGKDYKIPVCASDENLELSKDIIEKYSIFEDNSYIDEVTKRASIQHDDIYTDYAMEYKNGKYLVHNTNCDGRGTGHTASESFEYDSYKIEGNTLEVFVKFAYFEPSISDYDKDYFAENIMDSYSKDAKILKENYDETFENLSEIPHALYKFTFKVDGDKLYPLTVEMQ